MFRRKARAVRLGRVAIVSRFLWGAVPYVCILLFFVVPVIRMATRPYEWSTRASGLFNRQYLGWASNLFHWGLVMLIAAHLMGLAGGVLGIGWFVDVFFYWVGMVGGFMTLTGSVMTLIRRFTVPEVRAMSQSDDYLVHCFIIPIIGLALYQVLINRIFGVSFTASAWIASLWTLSPQPELMASANLLNKLHVLLALAFFAYLPFTKIVHVWTFPINYFVRPYQSMRTVRNRFKKQWEFGLRTDKSFLIYAMGLLAATFLAAGTQLGRAESATPLASVEDRGNGEHDSPTHRLMGGALYVSQCARCHGYSGEGDGAGAKSQLFATTPRDLTAGHFHFVGTDNGVSSSEDISTVISLGLVSAGMPEFSQLPQEQSRSLVAVVEQLWEERPEPGQAVSVPPRPASTGISDVEARRVFEMNCMACHATDGRGDGPLSTVTLDWQNDLVAPADLASGAVKVSDDGDQLYLRIAAGIGAGYTGYLMPSFDEALSPEEIWALVGYLQSEILPD